ncbi:hypothetical protein AG1IA_00698 [Rhizoctonia solani AG-1 IA]|uniref:Uncharacterized protein n=1 Tax=Thanatephorus cucumeris (strain AG1-IA) TaxID=983506 RepID=L8X871_THACA|nr:hypothetical protein AG1IA_00698 [Rhizoctonia solani AG-1 IA]
MTDARVPAGGTFLAHGAAADVWLVDDPDSESRKVVQCVLKVIRLSLDTLNNYQDPKLYKSSVDPWICVAHVNVVRITGINEQLDLRVEYLTSGTAPQEKDGKPISQCIADPHIGFFLQIEDVLAGSDYLHSQTLQSYMAPFAWISYLSMRKVPARSESSG